LTTSENSTNRSPAARNAEGSPGLVLATAAAAAASSIASACSAWRIRMTLASVGERLGASERGVSTGSGITCAPWPASRPCARPSRCCVISARNAWKRSSWFIARRSRGRGTSTTNDGPSRARGPVSSGMMRSAIISASSTSFVISSAVLCSSPQIRTISSCRLARVNASSADSGSSISNTSGFVARARATDTRWRMPPDSCAGFFSAAAVSPTMAMYRATRSARWRAGSPANTWSTASAMLSRTVSHGISE
jgi:hypothetical protein